MSTSGDAPTEKEIFERLENRDHQFNDVHGRQLRRMEYGGGLRQTRLEIWETPPDKYRLQVRSTETIREFDFEITVTTDLGRRMQEEWGDEIIRNRDKIWIYDREANRYQFFEFDRPTELAGPLTNPPMISSLSRKNYEATYDGKCTVVGRDTYAITFRPTVEAESFHRQYNFIRVWVDREHWLPIKQEAEYRLEASASPQTSIFEIRGSPDHGGQGDGTLSETNTLEAVEFDTGIEDSIFTFEPPDEAELDDSFPFGGSTSDY